MIRLICLDIDGTLVNSKKEVTMRTVKAIEEAQKKGVTVTIASGRVHQSVAEVAQKAGIRGPLISMNGALIKDEGENKVIHEVSIGKESLLKVLEELERSEIRPNLYTKDGIFVSTYFDFYRAQRDRVPEDIPFEYEELNTWEDIGRTAKIRGDVIDKIIFFTEETKKKPLMKDLSEIPGINVVSSSSNNVEITGEMADKGKACVFLGEKLGISPDEIMCVGDQFNDESMLNAVKYSVAMGNAPYELKKRAYHVTEDNDSDGCAKAIEKLVLEMGK